MVDEGMLHFIEDAILLKWRITNKIFIRKCFPAEFI